MTERPEGENVESLVRRAQAGSAEAFGELVARYESPLYNFLLRRTSSAEDAEDVAQEAFVRAWRKIDSYDPRWSFSTWLFTLARRLAASRGRAARSSLPPANDPGALDGVAVQADPGGELVRTEERSTLWTIADRVLESEARSALWLRYAEDLTVSEVAEVLGRSSVSVRVMLFRARAKLGKHLEPRRLEPLRAGTTAMRRVGI
jgi:RNA polymerase sigma-70 factor (ECF subfamily)